MQSFFCPLYDAHIVHQEQKDFGHGRIETRTMSSIVDPLSLDPDSTLDKWDGLKSIHMMTRVRTDKKTDKSTSETTFCISSLTDGTEVFKLIREHWAVENKRHYMLDMLFREDYSTERVWNVAQNMNIINKINLTIIQQLKDKLKATSTLRLKNTRTDDSRGNLRNRIIMRQPHFPAQASAEEQMFATPKQVGYSSTSGRLYFCHPQSRNEKPASSLLHCSLT